MDIDKAISIVNDEIKYTLLSYLEYDNCFLFFIKTDWEYDDSVIIFDKNTHEVSIDTLFYLYCNNNEVAYDEREPIVINKKEVLKQKFKFYVKNLYDNIIAKLNNNYVNYEE